MNRDYHTPGIICTRKYLIPLIHCRCHRYTQARLLPPSLSRFLSLFHYTRTQPPVLSLALALFIALETTLYLPFYSWYTLRYEREIEPAYETGAPRSLTRKCPHVHFAVLDSNRGTRALAEGVIHAKSSSSRLVASHCTWLVLTECLRDGPWLNRATDIIANFDNDEVMSIRSRVTIVEFMMKLTNLFRKICVNDLHLQINVPNILWSESRTINFLHGISFFKYSYLI